MATTILVCFVLYTSLLFLITRITSRRASNDSFFRGDRKSPWYVVAYGMIGASLSGVTFMSVPGGVYSGQFTYFPLVLGYILGYLAIAYVLLPLYYKLNLTSIYSYLGDRIGLVSEKTGSMFFIISRLLGSALRMYLVVFVLYEFMFKLWNIPFWIPAVVFIVIILAYTLKGGIKTIIWTDTLQTTFLLLAAIITLIYVLKEMDFSLWQMVEKMTLNEQYKVFETDWHSSKFYLKQILSGAFITITMTGLDQDMMQKNLTCKSLKDAQKNMISFSLSLVVVNVLFLLLGGALVLYAQQTSFALPTNADGVVVNDKIFPSIAFHLTTFTSVVFVVGLIAAGYSSADGTLTALTTTFYHDFLHFDKNNKYTEKQKIRFRKIVHISFAFLYLLIIIAFKPFHNQSLIDTLFDVAAYTYGPLLGLYAFGMFTKQQVKDKYVPIVAILSPVICYILNLNSVEWFGGYKFGFEMILLNGLLTCLGLCNIRKRK